MRSSKALLVVALIALATAVQPVGVAKAIDPSCSNVTPAQLNQRLPWAQRMYDPVNQLWPFSLGAGVTVAVLDTGVDATHFQMKGQVLPGLDFLGTSAGTDCNGHGTAVASIIAAREADDTGFVGLAPLAKILPVRLDDKPHSNPTEEGLSPLVMAQAIDYAVAAGANVIAASAVTYFDDPALSDAVNRAMTAGVVIVAAAGDGQPQAEVRLGSPQPPPPETPYPAAYEGVIGVGAIDELGNRLPASQIGEYVDLVAPGVDIIAAGLDGHVQLEGTGIAVGFVAAAVALLLGQQGSEVAGLSGAQRVNVVAGRLRASADGRGGGSSSFAYGAGTVDPYRAMTESPGDPNPQAVAGRQPPPRDEAAIRLAAQRAASQAWALRSAAILGALALVAVAAAYAIPRGRRRRWRPSRERAAVRGDEDKRPEFLPGEMLFRQTSPDAPQ